MRRELMAHTFSVADADAFTSRERGRSSWNFGWTTTLSYERNVDGCPSARPSRMPFAMRAYRTEPMPVTAWVTGILSHACVCRG
jgi:hypothetical protein